MARALLTIDVDASAVTRTFGDVREDARSLSSFIRGEFARVGDAIAAPARAARREYAQAFNALRREEERATQAAEDASRRRQQIAQAEGGYRASAARSSADEAARAEDRATDAARRGSQRRIDAAKREVAERGAVLRSLTSIAEGGGQMASALHGATQAPRRELASINATLAGAFAEGGATAPEVTRMQRRVLEFAGAEGMDPAALAQSLQGAQQQFSTLSGADPGARRAALERALRTAKLAHDTISNPAEVMRLGGALGGLGSEDTINNVLRSAIGISRRGGVELGSLSAQNLSTIQAQMAAAVSNLRRANPNATEADASQAMVQAFTQTLAQLEVLAPRGLAGRSAGTAVQQLGSSLHDPRVAGALRTRLTNEFGARSSQVSRLFDERGGLRAEYLDEMGGERFGRALTSIAGGDPDRIRALLGRGTRAGDRGEILHANQRDLIARLAGQDAGGRTGWDALVGMREGANDVNDADVARTRAIVQGLDATRIQRAEVAGMTRARNGSLFGRVSDAVSDFTTANPLLTAAAQTIGIGGVMRAIGARGGAQAALKGLGAAAPGVGARVLGPLGAFFGTLLTPSNAGQANYDDAALIRADRAAGGGARGRAAAVQAMQGGPVDLTPGTIRALADAIAQAPPTIAPHDAVHAATTGATRVAPTQ